LYNSFDSKNLRGVFWKKEHPDEQYCGGRGACCYWHDIRDANAIQKERDALYHIAPRRPLSSKQVQSRSDRSIGGQEEQKTKYVPTMPKKPHRAPAGVIGPVYEPNQHAVLRRGNNSSAGNRALYDIGAVQAIEKLRSARSAALKTSSLGRHQ
jgi:hypothetical protein